MGAMEEKGRREREELGENNAKQSDKGTMLFYSVKCN